MLERSEMAMRGSCGTGIVPGAWLAGALTLLLSGICWADAFVVPGLFGPIAAAVVATERLVCAARSSSTRAAAVWTGIAFGWIAVAGCMLHTPLLIVRTLQWLVVLLVGASAACRIWSRWITPPAERTPLALSVVAVGVAAQFAALFGAPVASLARIAAAVAIELAVIGVVRLLHAARASRGAPEPVTGAAPRVSAAADRTPMIELETEIA